MQQQTPINKQIVEERMQKPLADYLQDCIEDLEKRSDRNLLQGLGELMDEKMKTFVKTKLRMETISLFKIYKDLPLLEG
jgi:hypothetical protein